MPDDPTLAAALVRGLRANGSRPTGTGTDAETWSARGDRARYLALALADAGWSRRRVAVTASGDPALDVERELGLLSAGAVLVVAGAEAEAVLADGALRPTSGPDVALDELVAEGAHRDAREPAAAEALLATLMGDDPAVVDPCRTVTHGEARWALRAVDRWLAPVIGPGGPGVVHSAPGAATPALPAAVVGRWWPASVGARLGPTPTDAAGVGGAPSPDLALLSPAAWAALAQRVRDEAGRSWGGPTLLHRGRLVISGESSSAGDRLALGAARWWAGPRVRYGAGLDGVRLGLALAPVDPGTTRDLAAVGIPFTPTWCADGVPAPIAAGPLVRAAPAGPWGRPLPGRRVELATGQTVIGGGDLPVEGLVVDGGTRVDPRGRVALPRWRAAGRRAGAHQ